MLRFTPQQKLNCQQASLLSLNRQAIHVGAAGSGGLEADFIDARFELGGDVKWFPNGPTARAVKR